MESRELSKQNFHDTVAQDGIVVVEGWAPWCGVCKMFAPVFAQTARRFPTHTFATLDTEAEPALAEELGVENLPSLMVFRDGILLFNEPGNFKAEDLADIVSQAENLDMKLVRADIESDAAEAGCA
jgi:thioredoxin 1